MKGDTVKRTATHPLTLIIVAAIVLYVLFAYLVQPPLPRSLLVQYMLFAVVGVLMVATFDDATYKRLVAPIQTLLGAPAMRIWRALALVVVVAGASSLTYAWSKPSIDAPVELRSVHPAPPSSLRVYGKKFDLAKLTNPLREDAPKGSEAFAGLVAEGQEIYYKNCVFCHGANLGGKGVFEAGFNPRPANFQDVGTIAQLQESYLFWRITTGGPGFPREGAPWASSMPVWEEMLKEDEVWKVIMFLYDYTGYEPRSWELAEATSEQDGAVDAEPSNQETANQDLADQDSAGQDSAGQDSAGQDSGRTDQAAIERIYASSCAQCHGAKGEGDGVAAEFLNPKPRDFSLGVFKYKTSHADSEFPFDADLRKTIRDGLPGTAMSAWGDVLSDAQVDGLIALIKQFGAWDGETLEDLGTKPIEMGQPVALSDDSLVRGAKLYQKACVQCHGAAGRGNVTSGKKLKDDWGERIWPRNLTRPETWRWTKSPEDIFQRISAGIRGTPMPEYATTMPDSDRWDIVNYTMSLQENAVQLSEGKTILRAARIDGELPSAPEDPKWEQALPITFSLVPNVIKEGRLFFSPNERVTARALFNGTEIALRLDVDDRTFSVPGDPEEARYRDAKIAPTPDATAVQFPAEIPTTSEKPWFRHGNPGLPVNMWYWRAPSREPAMDAQTVVFDAAGPDKAPTPREGEDSLRATGAWADGQWRVVFTRTLVTDEARDLQFEAGRYIPISFANWDGWAGQAGSRHTATTWYWLLLEPEDRPALLFGSSAASGVLVGALFLVAARRQRRRYHEREEAVSG